ncbi:lipocalin family protein [Methylomonas sp. BW4-1]|uniref:lipocalin family protein n=1 Tax=Methylomonas sp. BW4-1 TaxID=3376685 RepID=UPI004042D726
MQFIKLSAVALLFLSFHATAEVQLTKADVLGTWQIDKESNTSDGSKARSSNTTWTFKDDGTIEGMTHENDSHARLDQMRAVLNYAVEGGKIIKQAAPGRSKMETCEAIEKSVNNMVLKCQTVYFFMSKK